MFQDFLPFASVVSEGFFSLSMSKRNQVLLLSFQLRIDAAVVFQFFSRNVT